MSTPLTIPCQIQSLVRRNKPMSTKQHHTQVVTKEIQTFQGSLPSIQSCIQNQITPYLEDPQCIPHLPAYTIQRNQSTQPQLPRTATWYPRRQTQMGSQADPQRKTIWSMEEEAIPWALERVLASL